MRKQRTCHLGDVSLCDSREREKRNQNNPYRPYVCQIPKYHIYIHLSSLLCRGLEGIPQSFEVLSFSLCIWFERVKNTSSCSLPHHVTRLAPFLSLSPLLPITPVFPLVLRKKKNLTGKIWEMFSCFPHQSVGKKVLPSGREQNLWKLSSDFTPGDDVKWINLPRRGRVLTTGSALSQWDLLRESPEGSPVA